MKWGVAAVAVLLVAMVGVERAVANGQSVEADTRASQGTGVEAFASMVSAGQLVKGPGVAVKPGKACARLGQSTIWEGAQYTCIARGNRRVWDGGVDVTPPTAPGRPSPSPTPDPSPSGTTPGDPGSGTSGGGAGSGAASVVPAPSAASLAALSGAVSSGSTTTVAEAIAMPAGVSLAPAAVASMQALGPISFDTSTFERMDAQTGTVQATVQGEMWDVVLVAVDGKWKIGLTSQVTP